jgi:hypothetical protein
MTADGELGRNGRRGLAIRVADDTAAGRSSWVVDLGDADLPVWQIRRGAYEMLGAEVRLRVGRRGLSVKLIVDGNDKGS